ncbi:MAG: transcription termination/antitermination factor NusG [Bacteroidales bacterium]|jgi:transcriptional antiterminator NusG|nr:transcription termination/antitermination factor NusG [Bacteroidales bacterium]MBP5722434.1 transcription termination/antitermination factor NusG [Bacteroidales bacterium]MBR4497647.1 transcription termination/antitermination factor NusG [Bacteroidales bacterium]MBR4691038.1 transcription termination/antitermination factor NusG [Bacteroidales bacterium]MBR7035979.1 transcription termination/antitermination factor NusG [Bacteroidales bacterium]
MAEVTGKKWYVVKAMSGKEKKVQERIMYEISRNHLEDYVSQVLIPTEKIVQAKNGKKISKERNYLPGYVLIEAVLEANVDGTKINIAGTINNIDGVIGFLTAERHGGAPMPLRLNEVNRILGKVDELAESEDETMIPFVVGEVVKVIDGPFNGFSGSIEKVNEEKKKLSVEVKVFGRKTLLELGFMQVEKES